MLFRSTGALAHAMLGLDHRRAPDIGLVLASDDAVNAHGLTGASQQDSAYPVGGGLHGGLHRKELHNWLAVGGSVFAGGRVVECPSGIVDVLPTVLHLLGIAAPESVEGRVLHEAFDDGPSSPHALRETVAVDGADGYRAHLEVSRVGDTRYLERAWVERSG